jgi:PKD repeat protein
MKNNGRIVKLHHLFMILLVTVFAGCTKRPTAQITSDKKVVTTGENINFINTSEDADSYLWDFGDGTTSNVSNPVKNYSTPGLYTVKFTAFGKDQKKTSEALLFVSVSKKPVNTYFVGSYNIDATVTDSCIQTHNTYTLTVNPGTADDEVILENFMDKRINGVTAKVIETSTGFKLAVHAQVRQDNLGNSWEVVAEGDYIMEKITGDPCVYVKGGIRKVGTSDCIGSYSEEGASCAN